MSKNSNIRHDANIGHNLNIRHDTDICQKSSIVRFYKTDVHEFADGYLS